MCFIRPKLSPELRTAVTLHGGQRLHVRPSQLPGHFLTLLSPCFCTWGSAGFSRAVSTLGQCCVWLAVRPSVDRLALGQMRLVLHFTTLSSEQLFLKGFWV